MPTEGLDRLVESLVEKAKWQKTRKRWHFPNNYYRSFLTKARYGFYRLWRGRYYWG